MWWEVSSALFLGLWWGVSKHEKGVQVKTGWKLIHVHHKAVLAPKPNCYIPPSRRRQKRCRKALSFSLGWFGWFWFLFNSFVEIQFTYHILDPFKVLTVQWFLIYSQSHAVIAMGNLGAFSWLQQGIWYPLAVISHLPGNPPQTWATAHLYSLCPYVCLLWMFHRVIQTFHWLWYFRAAVADFFLLA